MGLTHIEEDEVGLVAGNQLANACPVPAGPRCSRWRIARPVGPEGQWRQGYGAFGSCSGDPSPGTYPGCYCWRCRRCPGPPGFRDGSWPMPGPCPMPVSDGSGGRPPPRLHSWRAGQDPRHQARRRGCRSCRIKQTKGGQVPDRAGALRVLDHSLLLAAFRHMDKKWHLSLCCQFLGPLQGLIRAGIGRMGKYGRGDAGMPALPCIQKLGRSLHVSGRVGHARGGKINDPLGSYRPHPRINKGLRRLSFKKIAIGNRGGAGEISSRLPPAWSSDRPSRR